MAHNYDWESLSPLKLKAYLRSKDLSTEGSTAELVNRIVEHEADKDKEKTEGADVFPMLSKICLKYGCEMITCLRTVHIKPYQHDVAKIPEVASIFDETPNFSVRKTKDDPCEAVLRFDTIDTGDTTFLILKEKLQNSGCEVQHPLFPPQGLLKAVVENFEVKDVFENMFGIPTEDFLSRIIVLENLPENSNVDEKLNELFPEALKTYSFQFNPSSQGIAILEFQSQEVVEKFLTNSQDGQVVVEGTTVRVTKFLERSTQWLKDVREKQKERRSQNQTKPQTPFNHVVLSDDDRILLATALKDFKEEPNPENSQELFGVEKIHKFQKKNEIMRSIVKALSYDTRLRLKKGETKMPEPENLQGEYILKLLEKVSKTSSGNVGETALPTESGHMSKIKIYEQQRRKAEAERVKLDGIIRSMEGQLKGTEKLEWEQIKSGGEIRNGPQIIIKKEGSTNSGATADTTPKGTTKLSMSEQQNFIQKAKLESQKKNAIATMKLIQAKKALGSGGRGGGRGSLAAGRGSPRGRGGSFTRGGAQRGGSAERGGARGRGQRGRGGAWGQGQSGRGGAEGNPRGRGQRGQGFSFGQARSDIGTFGQMQPPPIPGFIANKRKAGQFSNNGSVEPLHKRANMSQDKSNDSAYLENMASALDDKMRKLEQLQEQTLRTQHELLQQQRSKSAGGLLGDVPGRGAPDYVSPYGSGPSGPPPTNYGPRRY